MADPKITIRVEGSGLPGGGSDGQVLTRKDGKSAWGDAPKGFSGSWNDLTDKPTIPEGLPDGDGANQQLVTDGDGNKVWADRLCYEGGEKLTALIENKTYSYEKGSYHTAPADDLLALDVSRDKAYRLSGSADISYSNYTFDNVEGTWYDNGDLDLLMFPINDTYGITLNFTDSTIFATRLPSFVNPPSAGGGAYILSLYQVEQEIVQLDEKFLPTAGPIIQSSTEGSTKRFRLTVDDSGTITATEIT